MGINVESIFLIGALLAVTIYLIVAALEDGKTCQVTRWKHLIAFGPVMGQVILQMREADMLATLILLTFLAVFIGAGFLHVYGLADSFVFANLTLLFWGICGVMGIGLVNLIMALACFSFLGEKLVRGLTFRKFLQNEKTAFIPHILLGYGAVMVVFIISTIV